MEPERHDAALAEQKRQERQQLRQQEELKEEASRRERLREVNFSYKEVALPLCLNECVKVARVAEQKRQGALKEMQRQQEELKQVESGNIRERVREGERETVSE